MILPTIDFSFQQARACTKDDLLIVTTGRLRRVWRWIDAGFATSELVLEEGGLAWCDDVGMCDWQMPDGSEPSGAELSALRIDVQDDEGFTSKHLCVEAEIAYPVSRLSLKFVVWVYPGAPGVRTQLWAKRPCAGKETKPDAQQGGAVDACLDRVPIGGKSRRRRLFGYYNDTQRRNDTHLDILKEEVIDRPLIGREWCDWASALCVEDDSGGFALVKESHKCVNQGGHATGGFVCDDQTGALCTGWGLQSDEISEDKYTPGWATWCVAWSGGDLEREVALKTFDRLRYPIDPNRDIYIQANTWGSTSSSSDARRAACQESVLRELEVCAELGIDVLQIDDGWQVAPGNETWQPSDNGWHPHPKSYPAGWAAVRARAKDLGVKLGLWAAAVPISVQELKDNYLEGGFVQYKLDFAALQNRSQIDALMQKVRDFIKWTQHKVRVNWDVTENPPRFGYFFAREYGCIYLENRKPRHPLTTVYRPHTVLRDLWQVSKYLNLHRFQCSIQNVDSVDRQRSDAWLHSHSYATAIALMGIPLFFQETKYHTDAAKAEIRNLLDVYRQHRESIYRGIVHPIGQEPNNASWTGFQCHLAGENRGYLMLFRERCNFDTEVALKLGWLAKEQIRVTDLLDDRQYESGVGSDGAVRFQIEQAPGFRFLEYRTESAG